MALRLNPESKICLGVVVKKKILYETFRDMLFLEIARRQKVQFSDGVQEHA